MLIFTFLLLVSRLLKYLKNHDMHKEVSANWKDALKQEVQLALNKNQKDILTDLNQTFEKILER